MTPTPPEPRDDAETARAREEYFRQRESELDRRMAAATERTLLAIARRAAAA